MPYRAGVLETGVTGGVGSVRRDLFAGCHFAFPWFSIIGLPEGLDRDCSWSW
jgi:hypothetical protein